jgi:hypothetical protein
MREMKKLVILVLFFLITAIVHAQQFQYQFQDKPTEEANVVVVSHGIRQGSGSDSYLVGKVFNRGLKPAKNVRIVYTVRNLYGAQLPTNQIYLNPADIAPTSFAEFEGRLHQTIDLREHVVTVQVEWDK